MKAYIGIDPGKKGGIAIIGGGTVEVYPMSENALVEALKALRGVSCVCCLERVHAMPGQGVTSMFTFGEGFGFIKGVLASYGIPYELVTPQKWKKEFSVTGDKNSSVQVCERLFPGVDLRETPRCRKAHDGMAEALLMAEYARRKMQ